MSVLEKELLKGIEFLLKETSAEDVFIPEDFNEEQLMIKETALSFVNTEIHPIAQDIEKQKEGLSKSLMRKAGELGLLGAHMPEEYNGMNLDFISNALIGEAMGTSGSFSVTYNAHIGIGMLPIYYFGTEAQKAKYLPSLSLADTVASYCLTEPSSGSDALSAKTRADLSEDGKHYIINGQKMWITNAGFADVFTVFAQIDGDKFTGFLIERDTPGLTFGAEEDKLGIKGSSTRQLFLENVKVPVENVLGEIGKGHLIAFNALNMGRYKLGVSCLGGIKLVVDTSVKYANERMQFGKPISSFGAIQKMIAEQARNTFTLESTVYRVGEMMGEMTDRYQADGLSLVEAKLKSAEEFALECSIIKIFGSEVLDLAVDHGVQIHGGMGYSEENPMARAYRDARINRIFEGTNEINRMLMISILMKRAQSGDFDLATAAMKVQSEMMSQNLEYSGTSEEEKTIENLKKLNIMLLGVAGQQVMSKKLNLKTEQQLLMNFSNIITEIFKLESLYLRVSKLSSKGLSNDAYDAMVKVQMQESAQCIYTNAWEAIPSIVDESMYAMLIKATKQLTKVNMQPIAKLNRVIASKYITQNEYPI